MKLNRVLIVATTLLLLVPALIVGPAEAAERVVDAPQQKDPVYYTDVDTTTVLYLRDVPDHNPLPSGGGAQPQTRSAKALTPAEPPVAQDSASNLPSPAGAPGSTAAETAPRPRSAAYPVVPANTVVPTSLAFADFKFDPNPAGKPDSLGLRHGFTIRDQINVRLFIQAPPGLKYTVELYKTSDAATRIADGTFTDTTPGVSSLDRRAISIPLRLSSGAATAAFSAGDHPLLRIYASQPTLSANQVDAGTWTLVYDEKEHASHVELSSVDALKVASWTQTRESNPTIEPVVTSLFRNYTGRSDFAQLVNKNSFLHEIDGRWIAKSAFGLSDLRQREPVAEIWDSSQKAITINPWNPYDANCRGKAPVTTIPMKELTTAEDRGVRVFGFKYRGDEPCLYRDFWMLNHTVGGKAAAGEYTLRVKWRYAPSAPASEDTLAAWRFQVSAIDVRLAPFSDGTVTEATSHPVLKGADTTFLMNLTNGGAANDTIKVTVQLAAGSGFSVQPIIPVIGDVQQVGANLFKLGPGNSTILAITIRAPSADSAVGTSATYEVIAESTTDATAESARKTLTLTAGPVFATAANAPAINQALHQPRILARSTEFVPPGEARLYSAYVWNRYVLPQNINVQMGRDGSAGWAASLVQNGRAVKTATMQDVPAGGVAGFNLQVSVERGAQSTLEKVSVNATLPSGGITPGIKEITFRSRILEAFEVRILDVPHAVEVCTGAGTQAGCTDAEGADYLNGAWYRVWITNNLASTETFEVSATVRETPAPSDLEATTTVWTVPRIGHRDTTGAYTSDPQVEIPPGKTAERYVFVQHDPDTNKRATNNNEADVTIRVRPVSGAAPATSRVLHVDVATATLGSHQRVMGVHIQPVSRIAPYTLDSPFVDLSQINSRTTQGSTGIGEFALYRMRVTNTASWWTFYDPLPNGPLWDHRVNVTVTGVDTDTGWSAYFRLSKGDTATGLTEKVHAAVPASCSDAALNDASKWTPALPGKAVVWPPSRLATNGQPDPSEPVDLSHTNGLREGFWDGELEVLVCAPQPSFPVKPLAGQFDDVQVQVRQVGPRGDSDTKLREIRTFIRGVPDVTVVSRLTDDRLVVPISPRTEGLIPIFLANNGSYLTNVSLEAKFKPGEQQGWTITGATLVNVTPLRAFENRSLAFRVLPPLPTGGGAGATVPQGRLEITARYLTNLYDPSSAPKTSTISVLLIGDSTPQKLSLGFGAASSPCAGTATSLTCTAQVPADRAEPMPSIAIPLTLANTDANQMTVRISVPTTPGWVFAETNRFSFAKTITVPASSTVADTILVRPPREAVAGSYADLVITSQNTQDPGQISTKVARIVIQGGLSLVRLDVAQGRQFVERNNTVQFPIAIRNEGNVDGHFRLQARLDSIERAPLTQPDTRLCTLPQPQCWTAWVEDLEGRRLDNNPDKAATIFLARNELRYVNLTVKAPLFEQENALANARLTAWNSTRLDQELGRIDVKAEIQDYRVEVSPGAESMTLIPGLAGSLLIGIKNTGDANDTLNLSLDTGGLPWRWQFSSPEVFLTAGSSTAVRLTIQTPIDPLPAPRTAKFWVFLGTRGGQAVNVSAYDFEPLFVTVPEYRQLDVDRDNITELAVDADRDRSNGFESFHEYSSLVRVAKVVDKALGKDKHTKYLLDLPSASGTYDSLADRYWDPDTNLVSDVQLRFDIDRDNTADYLLDTDGDGIVETAYQAATRQFLKAERVRLLGADAGFQYLIDQNGDGKPDKYFDPVKNIVTKITAQSSLGADWYAVDTDDDGRTDLYYNDKSKTTTPVAGIKIVDFAKDYWYVFAGFAGILVLFGIVLMRRRGA